MKNTDYKDVLDIGNEALSMDNKPFLDNFGKEDVNNINLPFTDFDKPNSLETIRKNEINYDLGKTIQTPYTYYYEYIGQNSEESLYDLYFKTSVVNSKSDILIFYLANSKTDLFIKLTNKSDRLLEQLSSRIQYQYSDSPTKKTSFKEKMILNILRDASKDFIFTYDEVAKALDEAIQDFSFIKSDKNTPLESKYTISINQLKDKVNLKEKGTAQMLLEIAREIAKMRAAEKHSYNEWINSQADPYNYFGIHPGNNKSLSFYDLKALIKQLRNYKKNSEDFRNGRIASIKDLQDFVEKNLTAGGDKFKWFINTPFFNLGKSLRKTYINMFCTKDESFFSRITIAGGVSHGDLVLMLFSTCTNQQDLLEIILELEKDNKLFQLLYNLKLDAFRDLSILISNVYMKHLENEKKTGSIYTDAIESGRQLYFDNSTFGNHNIENFDTDNKKLVFETRQNVILDLFTDADYDGTINAYLQKPVSCHPLDIINFIPKTDIEFENFHFLAKKSYQLPACLVYLLYRQESIDSVIFAGMFTLQVALCLTGVGEVIAAIQAGSSFGVIWTGSVLVMDTAFASTLIKEVQQDYPTYTKVVNYIIWVRIAAEFIKVSALREEINKGIKTAKNEIDEFIKRLPDKIKKNVNRLPKEWQMHVVKGMLKYTFQGRTLLKIDLKGIIWEIECFRDVGNAQIFVEFNDLKINTKVLNNKGKEIIKSYTDNVEVVKSEYKGRHTFTFRIKFDEGKIRDAEYMNYTHAKNSNNPPYATSPFTHSKVIDRILKPGEKFYIAEYKTATGPGNFLTNKPIFTISELREKLAVLESWKPIKPGDPLVIREYTVLKEIKVRDGYIGPMEETTKGSVNFGKIYKGGERQFECYDRPLQTDMDVLFERNDLFEKVLK